MKHLKKKWESELEMKLPDLNEDILNEPIPERTEQALAVKRKKPVFKYISFVSSIAAVLVICLSVIPILMIQEQTPPISDGSRVDGSVSSGATSSSTNNTAPSTPPSSNVTVPSTGSSAPSTDKPPLDNVEKEEGSIITVEINPRVIFVSDKNGIVTSVIATNADADVVLSCDGFNEEIIGKKTAEALVSYVDLATKLGYIDADSTENAVTITACDSESDISALAEAKESLEAHFKSKGVYAVVVDKTATVDELCQINELEKADKIEDIIVKFKDKSPLFSERKFDELEGEELESYYKETVIKDVKDDVLAAIKELKVILETADIDAQIIKMCFVDYWTVKDYAFIAPELQELVSAMEEKLLLLEQTYGNKIESSLQLYDIASQITSEYVEELFLSIDTFERTEDYKRILNILNRDASKLDRLDNIPTSKEEIRKEHESSLKAEGNNRLEQNKERYEKEREEIGKEDYDSFLDDKNNQQEAEREEGLPQGEGRPDSFPNMTPNASEEANPNALGLSETDTEGINQGK